MKAQQCTIPMGKTQDVLLVKQHGLAIPLTNKDVRPVLSHVDVVLDAAVQLPPYSEMEVVGRVPRIAACQTEGRELQRSPMMVVCAAVRPEDEEIPLCLLNWRDSPVSIPKGTAVAAMELLPEDLEATDIATVHDQNQGVPCTVQDRMWQMVEKTGSQLTQQQKEQLFTVILEYHDIFAEGPADFGCTDMVQHSIDTGDSRPIRQHVRRIPPSRREESRKLLQKMLERDVIQPSASPWVSPIVLVQKKKGSTRFCVDYRKVNKVTRKDAYPLPRIDDTLDTLSGAKWFSTLDLISGYWQVVVDPKDREKTAFCTPEGLFEFKVMPFGLCNAPA